MRSIAPSRHAAARLLRLRPTGARSDYLERTIGGKKRKELRRQRKRLADEGIVTRSATRDPAAIGQALSDFLKLEAGGWKGRAGTAASADRNVRDFMATAIAALAAEGKASIESLSVGSQPIASTIVLRSGANAWCWKIAYDERFAKASPGVQLVADLTQMLLDDATFAHADSCATADHPMIDHIWRERLPLADRLIAVRPDAAASFALARAFERLRRAAIDAAKAASNALRRG
jgi:CelD/BcsL family acetyltransferase involved in cellulose biosynthesis